MVPFGSELPLAHSHMLSRLRPRDICFLVPGFSTHFQYTLCYILFLLGNQVPKFKSKLFWQVSKPVVDTYNTDDADTRSYNIQSIDEPWMTPIILEGCLYLLLLLTQSCSTFCNPMNCSMPGFSVPNYLPEFAQIHFH